MSNGGGVIIICGTAGEVLGDVTITMYKGSVAGIALAYDPHAASLYPGVTDKDLKRIKRAIENAYASINDAFEDAGIPYTKHDPHPQP